MIIKSNLLEAARRIFSNPFQNSVTRYSLEEIEAVFAEAAQLEAEEKALIAQLQPFDYITGEGNKEQHEAVWGQGGLYAKGDPCIYNSKSHTNEMFPVDKWQKELARQRRINRALAKLIETSVEAPEVTAR